MNIQVLKSKSDQVVNDKLKIVKITNKKEKKSYLNLIKNLNLKLNEMIEENKNLESKVKDDEDEIKANIPESSVSNFKKMKPNEKVGKFKEKSKLQEWQYEVNILNDAKMLIKMQKILKE